MSTNSNIAKSMDNANGHISSQTDDSSNGTPSNTMSNGADSNQMASSQSTSISSSSSSSNIPPKAPLQKPSTTITRPPRQSASGSGSGQSSGGHTMSAQDHYVNQMGMARQASNNAVNVGGAKPDDYDPDSNVYVANLPRY